MFKKIFLSGEEHKADETNTKRIASAMVDLNPAL